jgi:hypothetical protein
MIATWNDRVEEIKDRYAARIVKVLESIRAELQAAGYHVDEPFDMSCDSFSWSLLVRIGSKPEDAATDGDVDINLKIAESTEYDGDGSEEGINFSLDVVEYGGRIMGGLTPYNYTRDVWVSLDDADAIEARFSIFEETDPATILNLFDNGGKCST